MKISTYHKLRGDHVEFVKGRSSEFRQQRWDRIYVATLFTFFWKETIRTVRYYAASAKERSNVLVGGVMATLMKEELEAETGVSAMPGLLDERQALDDDSKYVVDHMIPDYSLLDSIEYEYPIRDAYIGYATRGCPNQCSFCAVNRLEPKFIHYCPIKRQVRGIEEIFGPKKDLLLLDNNVLASKDFRRIIGEILTLGFERGAKFGGRLRVLDFNQGLDARRLSRTKMRLLAETCIRPLRLAFDTLSMRKRYEDCVRVARDCGVLKIGTYVLFNYLDGPESFYKRLKISAELNKSLGTKISSFPMKYIPLNAKDRTYVGRRWNRQLLRGVQCILLATRGIVSPRLDFFEAAFGGSVEEFIKIAMMPEQYIIYRREYEMNGARDWRRLYDQLTTNQREDLLEVVSKGRVTEEAVVRAKTKRLKALLTHYVEARERELQERRSSRN
jgi:hypothetical protein